DLLERTRDDRPVLSLNDASWEVMRGNRRVSLIRPKATVVTRTRGAVASWEGGDRGLFEHLRGVRRELADERGAPAFVIFGDASLRDMARTKPDSPEAFRQVHGVGEAKLQQFGTRFLAEIKAYRGQ
ncbi:MAG: HRDC domain-containing protein, partial [Planctomycetes bacterium]|nr:HRDC domain-containing protein [Planctomycetota bacterium]